MCKDDGDEDNRVKGNGDEDNRDGFFGGEDNGDGVYGGEGNRKEADGGEDDGGSVPCLLGIIVYSSVMLPCKDKRDGITSMLQVDWCRRDGGMTLEVDWWCKSYDGMTPMLLVDWCRSSGDENYGDEDNGEEDNCEEYDNEDDGEEDDGAHSDNPPHTLPEENCCVVDAGAMVVLQARLYGGKSIP